MNSINKNSSNNQYYIGTTRFSLYLPESSAWNLAQESEEYYLKKLFDPQRMRDRLDIFINKSLPIYQIMSKGFFYRHVVQYSTEMPLEYVRELESAAKKYPFLFLQGVDKKGNSSRGVSEIIIDQPDGTVGFFRVDDDDLLPKDYIVRLSKYVNENFHGMAVSFGKGYAAQYKNGKFCNFRQVISRFIAIGQCYITPWVKNSGNLNFPKIYSHNQLDYFIPVVSDSRFPSFIHTHHLNQDSNSEGDKKEILKIDIHPRLLELKRPDSYAEVASLFPSLQDDVDADSATGIVMLGSDNPIKLEKNPILLDVHLEPGGVYDVKYQLTIGNGIGIGRGVVFSVSSEDSQYPEEMMGLSLSSALSIGYFKYLASGGMGRGSFSFSIPKSYKKIKVSIFPWASKDYANAELNIKIYKIG